MISDEQVRVYARTLRLILACQLDRLPLVIFTQFMWKPWVDVRSMRPYHQCLRLPLPERSRRRMATASIPLSARKSIFKLSARQLQAASLSKLNVSARQPEQPFKILHCLPLLVNECRRSAVVAVKIATTVWAVNGQNSDSKVYACLICEPGLAKKR